ncbi:biotin--[acetyl-CoA-carboxylase] ligase [Porticoccaceae bacterium nBUS_09]
MSDLHGIILEILQDGEFHTKKSFGAGLAISSDQIDEVLHELQASGLVLISPEGLGYRLSDSVELLGRTAIFDYLSTVDPRPNCRLKILSVVDSTNRYAREQAANHASSGLVVLAEKQTAGRGRRGKVWVSPLASNIYMSVVWDFSGAGDTLKGLSLAIGVAVRRALLKLGVADIKLKWPNDIFVNGKKLGGILLEMIGDPSAECSVIVGIGINVLMSESSAEAIDQDWTDLQKASSVTISRNELVACLITETFEVLGNFQRTGFSVYRAEWQVADLLKNQSGTISKDRESVSGIVLGVDNSGSLRMRLSDGEEQRFIGGELSLRKS